jgi:hypothetical protein
MDETDDDFPEIEFTGLEEEVDRVEESWADCAAGFRAGLKAVNSRRTRMEGRDIPLRRSLLEVHEMLEKHRRDLASGRNEAGLFDVMLLCAEENLPLPYWAADALFDIESDLMEIPMYSLHEAFGLNERYPLTEKKAIKAQRNRWIARQFYNLVRSHPQRWISLDAAIRDVLNENPEIACVFSVRKATDVFHELSLQHINYY